MANTEARSTETGYEVVSPSGRYVAPELTSSPRLAGFDGVRIAFVWDYVFRGPEIFDMIKEALRKYTSAIEFIDYPTFGDIRGAHADDQLNNLPHLLEECRADAVVVGVGACGSCMPAVIRACALAERIGVPAVAIGGESFEGLGRATAQILGISDVPIASYPGVISADSDEVFRNRVASSVVPAVIAGLTAAEDATAADEENLASADNADDREQYEPTSIVFSGSLDEIMDHFETMQWTDGLPIVPPTLDRIEAFLAETDRDRNEILGVLPPREREATVWNVAVNGVMAGCRPEHMPVLIAIVEALADPYFRLQDAGSTPGWEPLVIVSGPVVKRLNFNSQAGVLKVGRRANTSVGRFTRLFMTTVPGLTIVPGITDQGAIGCSFNVALAEDGDTIQALGWPAHHVDRGFKYDDSIVTVTGVLTISPPIYSGGGTAVEHMNTISDIMADAIGPWFYLGLQRKVWRPLLVLSPAVARAIAGDGASKDDLRLHIHNRMRIAAWRLDSYAPQVGSTSFSLAAAAKEGLISEEYVDSSDPQRLVPLSLRPEWLNIVVAGHPGRNQSRAYIPNQAQGAAVSRTITFAR